MALKQPSCNIHPDRNRQPERVCVSKWGVKLFYLNMHRVSSWETMVSQNELHVLHHRNCETVKMFALHSLETNDISTDGSQGVCWGSSDAVSCQSMSSSSSNGLSDALHTFSLGLRTIFLRPSFDHCSSMSLLTPHFQLQLVPQPMLCARANQREDTAEGQRCKA